MSYLLHIQFKILPRAWFVHSTEATHETSQSIV